MKDIAVYVHIPYCIAKCPYCDFNSYGVGDSPSTEQMPEVRYTNALVAELKHYAKQAEWQGKSTATVFFGGGTPSLFSAKSIELILNTIDRHFPLSPYAEITLEANPGSIRENLGQSKLREFRQLGINRISTGAQGFSADKLKTLGRIHSAEDVTRAVDNINAAGFENFNIDLIFGVIGETIQSWRHDLESLCSLKPTHASAYCLTIEPGTEFSRLEKRGKSPSAADGLQAEMYQLSQQVLEQNGFKQYEISAYAKPGRECQHNLCYWRGNNYLGIGAGAHGYLADSANPLCGIRWANVPGPEQYIQRMTNGQFLPQRSEVIDREKSRLEFFFLGLRTVEGIDISNYEQIFGESFESRYQNVVQEMTQQKLLIADKQTLRLNQNGFLFADSVMNAFADC